MLVDPIDLLVGYLRTRPEIPDGAPTGDMVGREAGDTTVYLEPTGGMRMVRYAMDRFDVEYQVYERDREDAAKLAFTVRSILLEDLPGTMIGDNQVLDVAEISAPHYDPDESSREQVYIGEIGLFIN